MSASNQEENQLVEAQGATPSKESFESVEDVLNYVESVSAEDRYAVVSDMMEEMARYHERAGTFIEKVFQYVKEKRIYDGHVTEEEFCDSWQNIRDIITLNAK